MEELRKDIDELITIVDDVTSIVAGLSVGMHSINLQSVARSISRRASELRKRMTGRAK